VFEAMTTGVAPIWAPESSHHAISRRSDSCSMQANLDCIVVREAKQRGNPGVIYVARAMSVTPPSPAHG
jgi:hypothetical protein